MREQNALRWRHATTGSGGSGVRRRYFGSKGREGVKREKQVAKVGLREGKAWKRRNPKQGFQLPSRA